MKVHVITGQSELRDALAQRILTRLCNWPGITVVASESLSDAHALLTQTDEPMSIIVLDAATPIEPGHEVTDRHYTPAGFLLMAKNQKWPPVIVVGTNPRFQRFTNRTGIHPIRDGILLKNTSASAELDKIIDVIAEVLTPNNTPPRS